MYVIFHKRPDLAYDVSIYGQSWLSLLGNFESGDKVFEWFIKEYFEKYKGISIGKCFMRVLWLQTMHKILILENPYWILCLHYLEHP